MRILCTGVSGFVAPMLSNALCDLGHTVYGLERYVTGRNAYKNVAKYHHVFADLNDHSAIKQQIKLLQPEAVFHLAALSPVSFSYDNYDNVNQTNYLATINLAECCQREIGDFKQFLFASTCYDSETRAYTLDGLKRYDELKEGDKVLSLNLLTEKIEVDTITAITIQNYTGNMIQFKGRRTDLLVTPNHKMIIRNTGKHNHLVFEQASKVATRSVFHLPLGTWESSLKGNMSIVNGEPYQTDALFYFLGFFIGDGYINDYNRVFIAKTGLKRKDYLKMAKDVKTGQFQSLEQKPIKQSYPHTRVLLCIPANDKAFDRVTNVLKTLGIDYSEQDGHDQIYLHKSSRLTALHSLLKKCGHGAKNKHIPKTLLEYDSQFLNHLFRGLVDSDGSDRGNRQNITTVSETLATQLIELGTKLHKTVTVTKAHSCSFIDNRKIEGTCFRIYLANDETSLGKGYLPKNKDNVTTVSYSGVVWCPTVANNHNLLVERNGRTCFSGNSETYGNQTEFPIKESAIQHPNSPYAVSKSACELYLKYMRDAYGFPVTIAKPFNTFGRTGTTHFVTERIISQMVSGQKELCLGDPEPTRDYLYVSDHVSGYLSAFSQPEKSIGETFNFATGKGVTVRELVDILAEKTGWKGMVRWGTIPKRPLDIDCLIGDASKAKRVLGWEPQVSLSDGLDLAIEALR